MQENQCLETFIGVTSSVTQDRADDALFQSVFIIAAATIGIFILFLILKKCIPIIYRPYPYLRPSGNGRFRWIYTMLFYTDEELFRSHGLDMVMHFQLQKSNILCVSAFFVFGLLVLVPVNVTGSNQDMPYGVSGKTWGTAILSIANINSSTEQSRYVAHLLSVLFNSAVVYITFYHSYTVYLKFRSERFTQAKPENFTVMVPNVTTRYDRDTLMDIFNIYFSDKVLEIHRVKKVNTIRSLRGKRLDYIQGFERYIEDYKEQKEIKAKKKSKCKCCSRCKSNKDKQIRVRNMKPACLQCFQPFACCFKKVDAVDFYKERLRHNKRKMESKDPKEANTIFVTFKSRFQAIECSSTQFKRNDHLWCPSIAPSPKDLRWDNLHLSLFERRIRYTIILGVVIVIGFLYSAIVVFAQSLANIEHLAQIEFLSFLKNVSELPAFWRNLISGLVPPLVVVICFALLELLLKLLVLVESNITKSDAEVSFFNKLFYIQLFNVFLVTLFSASFLSRIDAVVECVFTTPVLDLIRHIGSSISGQVNYFISYVCVSILTSNIAMMIQPLPLIKYLLSKVFCCINNCKYRTYREKGMIERSLRFTLGVKTSQQIVFFVISITFASISPLILPFCLMFYYLNWITSRHFALFSNYYVFRGNGKMWPYAFNRTFICVIIYQIIMAGIFLVNSFFAGLVISLILAVLSIVFTYVISNTIKVKSETSTVSLNNDIILEEVTSTTLKNAYENPYVTYFDDKFFIQQYGDYLQMENPEEDSV